MIRNIRGAPRSVARHSAQAIARAFAWLGFWALLLLALFVALHL